MKQRHSQQRVVGGSPTTTVTSTPSLLPLHSGNTLPSPTRALKRKQLKKKKRIVAVLVSLGSLVVFCLLYRSIFSTTTANTIRSTSNNTTHYSDIPFYQPSIPPHIAAMTKEQLLDHWKPRPPILHLVHTRFMQEQGQLQALAHARLALFQTVCLPTMTAQTTQDFLWIIQVDPSLHRSVLQALLDLVALYPHFYIVPSNVNFRINQDFPGAWRDGAEIKSLQEHGVYYSSSSPNNWEALSLAMALEPHLPILETRLDADDGLHRGFLRSIQQDALEHRFSTTGDDTTSTTTTRRWMYWCARRHLEWHWSLGSAAAGRLDGITHDRLCVTPGLTVGFAVGTAERDVPIYPHHQVAKELLSGNGADCGGHDHHHACLQWVQEVAFAAVRSRTPTSAGMADVLVGEESDDEPWVQYVMWNALHELFGLKRPQLAWMNSYLKENLVKIARDNLLGQCTTGHSCKESAQADLERIIAMQDGTTNTTSRSP